MQAPLQITFHQLPPSEAVEADIRGWVDDLESLHPEMITCRVRVEAPHRHQQHGRLFRIGIDIGVPGHHLVVNRSPDAHAAHEDIYVAIRDAFRAARRQLEDYAQRRRGEVKLHQPSS